MKVTDEFCSEREQDKKKKIKNRIKRLLPQKTTNGGTCLSSLISTNHLNNILCLEIYISHIRHTITILENKKPC